MEFYGANTSFAISHADNDCLSIWSNVSGTWSEPFTVEKGGNVGIGTGAPVTKLDVFSGSGTKPDDPFSGQNQLFLSSGSTANAGLTIAADDGTNDIVSFFQSNQSADVGLIGTQSNHALRIRTNNSDRITILGGGNVGIGTVLPTYPFELKRTDNVNTYLSTENTGASNAGIRMKNSQGEWLIIANDRLRFYDVDNSSEPMSILANGNVGIGITGPGSRLHVNGTSASNNGIWI